MDWEIHRGLSIQKGKQTGAGAYSSWAFDEPDYTLKDVKALALNGYRKNKSLLNALLSIDLSGTLRNLTVSYLMLQGDADIVTSTKAIQEFAYGAQNRRLHFQLVKRSSHSPGTKEMETVISAALQFF